MNAKRMRPGEEGEVEREWKLRCKLAVAYRIAASYGWDLVIFNHITAKIPDSEAHEDGPHFLINPIGLRFDEVTAASLLKVTAAGRVIDSGSTDGSLFIAGYVIHSAIHMAREDVHCIWHCHDPDVAAVCITKHGLLPLQQEALFVYNDIAYHPFEGPAFDLGERERLARNLGKTKSILLMENHGPCVCAGSVEEAFEKMFYLTRACMYQQRALAMVGGDLSKLHVPSQAQLQEWSRRALDSDNLVISLDDGGKGGAAVGGVVPDASMLFRAAARKIEERDGVANIYARAAPRL
eukprot:g3063.t1